MWLFTNLSGRVWSSLLSPTPPVQIYLQPGRQSETRSARERHRPVSRRKAETYHISGVVRGQAEVSDLHVVVGVEEDVDGLQVSVNHTLKVTGRGEEKKLKKIS